MPFKTVFGVELVRKMDSRKFKVVYVTSQWSKGEVRSFYVFIW